MISVALVIVLTAIWVLLWGSLTVANVVTGLAVSVVVLLVLPGRRPSRPPVIRPLAMLRLGAYLVGQLAVSNVVLIREVLSRRSRISTGVVAVPLGPCSDELITLIANLIALTPGTVPVEVERHPAVIYVHVLHVRRVEDVRHQLWRLRDLSVAAFGRESPA
jgi:multicomponent Na+:H+ antiporter subunit E